MAKTTFQCAPAEGASIGLERRRSQRTDLVVRVAYQTVDQLFSDFARNINEGGIFVETESPQPVGTAVSLQFQLPGSEEPIELEGRVVRHTDGTGSSPPGMGIEFGELDTDARERIDELIRNLKSIRRV